MRPKGTTKKATVAASTVAVLTHEDANPPLGQIEKTIKEYLGEVTVDWYTIKGGGEKITKLESPEEDSKEEPQKRDWTEGITLPWGKWLAEQASKVDVICYYADDQSTLWRTPSPEDASSLPLAFRLAKISTPLLLLSTNPQLVIDIKPNSNPNQPLTAEKIYQKADVTACTKVILKETEGKLCSLLSSYLATIEYLTDDQALAIPENPKEGALVCYFHAISEVLNATKRFLQELGKDLKPLFSPPITQIEQAIGEIEAYVGTTVELAEAYPAEAYPEECQSILADLLTTKVSSSSQPPPLYCLAGWLLYSLAGAIHLYALSMFRSEEDRSVTGLQYAINAFDTAIWISWICEAVSVFLKNGKAPKIVQDKKGEMRFTSNGLRFTINLRGALSKLNTETIRKIKQIYDDLNSSVKEARNRSPLAHGFLAGPTKPLMNQTVTLLEEAIDIASECLKRMVKQIADEIGKIDECRGLAAKLQDWSYKLATPTEAIKWISKITRTTCMQILWIVAIHKRVKCSKII